MKNLIVPALIGVCSLFAIANPASADTTYAAVETETRLINKNIKDYGISTLNIGQTFDNYKYYVEAKAGAAYDADSTSPVFAVELGTNQYVSKKLYLEASVEPLYISDEGIFDVEISAKLYKLF